MIDGRIDGVAKFREAFGETLNGFELLGVDNVGRETAARIRHPHFVPIGNACPTTQPTTRYPANVE